MKSSILALVAAVGLVSADRAFVFNNCRDTYYVQSVPYDGSAAGPLVTVPTGGNFTEDLRHPGSTIKIDINKALPNPLFFGYSVSKGIDYYELSDANVRKDANPFVGNHNVLSAGKGCDQFDCNSWDEGCYSQGGSKVYHCPQPSDLTLTMCA